jgi:Bacterial mobilisation protein (MobC)
MARPRADYTGERRTGYFGFQLTPSERRILEHGAEQRGVTMAEYVRSFLPLATRPKREAQRQRRSRESAAIVGELGRIGNNLNQLARRANETGRIPELALLEPVTAGLKAAFSRIV